MERALWRLTTITRSTRFACRSRPDTGPLEKSLATVDPEPAEPSLSWRRRRRASPSPHLFEHRKPEMPTKSVNPIPEDMHTLTPHIVCAGAAKAIDFYKAAFGAVEKG